MNESQKQDFTQLTPSEVATIKQLKNTALMACILTNLSLFVSAYLSQWVLVVMLFIASFFALSIHSEIKKLL